MWETECYAVQPTVTREQASAAFINRLAEYHYTPLDILEPSILDSIQLVYVPYYHFSMQYEAEYSVNVGDVRWEQHTVYRTKFDEKGRSKQEPHTEWRSKTEWRPYLTTGSVLGNHEMRFADRTFQGGTFSSFVSELSWQTTELTPVSSVSSSHEILAFTRSPADAYREVVSDDLIRQIDKHIISDIPGTHHRDLRRSWYTTYESCTQVYLPIWRVDFSYQDLTQTTLIDGRSYTRITGQLPVDVELQRDVNRNLYPFWISLGIGVPLIFLISAIGGGSALVPWLIGTILLIACGVGVVSFKRRHEVLASNELPRKEAAERLLLGLTQGEDDSNAIK